MSSLVISRNIRDITSRVTIYSYRGNVVLEKDPLILTNIIEP